jgi:hypothetical protein
MSEAVPCHPASECDAGSASPKKDVHLLKPDPMSRTTVRYGMTKNKTFHALPR